MQLDREKFYTAIYEFLSEELTPVQAENQSAVMVDNILSCVSKINKLMVISSTDPKTLSKEFHILKNLLLYGDFYYESDLCQDIEIELRKSKKISNVLSMYEELINSLKM